MKISELKYLLNQINDDSEILVNGEKNKIIDAIVTIRAYKSPTINIILRSDKAAATEAILAEDTSGN